LKRRPTSPIRIASFSVGAAVGRLVFIAYRGQLGKHYFQHIKCVSQQSNGLVIPLFDKDLLVLSVRR
jgi:hypothetical protein